MPRLTSQHLRGSLLLGLLGLAVALAAGCGKPAATPLRFTLTCDVKGRLEPCGCFTGQMGGLTRIDSLLGNRLHPAKIRVDAGNAIAGPEDYQRIQYGYMLQAFAAMDFDALNMGLREAMLAADHLTDLVKAADVPLISANLYDARTGKPLLAPYRLVTRSGRRIAITGIVANRDDTPLGANMEIRDSEGCLDRLLPELKRKADILVLLAFDTEAGMARLARRFYEFDLILGGDVAQPSQDATTVNQSLLWYITNEARSLGQIKVIADDRGRLSFTEGESFLVHDRIPQAARTRRLVQKYRAEIRETRLDVDDPHRVSDSDIPGVTGGATYVGSASCAPCHEDDTRVWQHTGHSHAFRTLVDVGAGSDPNCIGCHVVGFGEPSGYARGVHAPGLMATGCESCHGPGSLHVARHADREENGFRFRPLGAGDCTTCHYGEFSRPFDWDTFWPRVAHGKEKAE